MSNQRMSFKDKITSHLPGHKNQDNNMNGVPDRLEKNRPGMARPGMATGGFATGVPLATGGAVIPGTTQNIATTTYTQGANGMPIGGNVLNDRTVTSQTIMREPALVQTTPFTVQQPALDLNRNGIPDNLEQPGFGFIGSVQGNQAATIDVREAPTTVQRVEKPAVVHEVYKTEEVVQIQPVIERERDQLDVYEVVQPIREREVIATEVRQLNLPAQTRATVVQDNSTFLAARSAPSDFSTREVAATRSSVVENAPIVHETIVHKVIEEVQPVIYKEIDRPIFVRETLPIYEKVVEAPHSHKSVLPMRDLGTRSVTTTTVVQPIQTGTAYQTTGLQSGIHSEGIIAPQQGFGTSVGMQQGFAQGQTLGMQQPLQQGFATQQQGLGMQQPLQGQQGFIQQPLGAQQGLGMQQQGLGMQQPLQPGLQSGLAGGFNDRNMNGIPDNMERKSFLGDSNGNMIPDALERRMGAAALNTRI